MSGFTLFVTVTIAFILWHFLPRRQPSKPTPKFRSVSGATASDPNWPAFIKQHCDSPAEVAYLDAMISAHKLVPINSSLVSLDIKLDFQVEIDRYRLDFLINDWLIVEIDGAAWHSSDDAKARDAERDKFFMDLGYSVIRIPAKVVFNDADEAVRRTTAALQVGKSIIAEPVQQSGFDRLGQTALSIDKFMSKLNEGISERKQLETAMRPAEQSYHTEKAILSAALNSAKHQIKIDDYLGDDLVKRAAYSARKQQLSEMFVNFYDYNKDLPEIEILRISPYLRPEKSGNAELDKLVEQRFERISAERMCYFDSVRDEIRKDRRLAPLVKSYLLERGNPELWHHVG